jgi:hypothetical protein
LLRPSLSLPLSIDRKSFVLINPREGTERLQRNGRHQSLPFAGSLDLFGVSASKLMGLPLVGVKTRCRGKRTCLVERSQVTGDDSCAVTLMRSVHGGPRREIGVGSEGCARAASIPIAQVDEAFFGVREVVLDHAIERMRSKLRFAMRCSSVSSFRKPGIVTFLSAMAMSNVRCSSRVHLAMIRSHSLTQWQK